MAPFKLMIVEDEHITALALKFKVEQWGYVVPTIVFSGEDVIAEIAHDKPDLVLMDISLSGEIDGITAAEQIKAQFDIPIIYMTAYSDAKTLKRAKITQPHGYILKPFEDQELRILIEMSLYKHQVEQESKQYRDKLEDLVQERTSELQRANDYLHKEIDQRKNIQEQLKKSLREKDVLLKEIHHRVKNNLQIISGLLDLQAEYIEDEQAQQAFQESQDRIQAMALIHESLYQNETLAEIDFAEYVNELITNLRQAYDTNKVNLKINIAPVALTLEQAIPCSLIINELISNALKHAFSADTFGQIWVELQVKENQEQSPQAERQLTLWVRDNGLGFSPDVDFRGAESLGLTLVVILVKQLKGTIEQRSQGGTEFKIVFTDVMTRL